MYVYCVFHQEAYEMNELIGVFSDIVKAREFELAYHKEASINEEYDWTVIRKVELDNVNGRCWDQIGEEV